MGDKFATAKEFKDISPKTFLVNNLKELKKAVKEIDTNKIIIKPREGVQGIGAGLFTKDKLPKKIDKEVVVQEFIDSSDGIKELGIKGIHDLRVILLNGKIDHSYVRLAEKGDFRSNCAKGGSKIFVDNDKIPKDVLKMVNRVNKKFKNIIPRLHTVDVVFGKDQKPVLMEFESQLGTYYYKGHKDLREKYYHRVFKAIKKSF